MAVDVWAELAFKAGCVFESHATNTSFTPKTQPVFPNTELTRERRPQTSGKSQCQDFLTQGRQSVASFYTLLVIVPRWPFFHQVTHVILYVWVIYVGGSMHANFCTLVVSLHLIWVESLGKRGRKVAWPWYLGLFRWSRYRAIKEQGVRLSLISKIGQDVVMNTIPYR